jgi:hypothetical protein
MRWAWERLSFPLNNKSSEDGRAGDVHVQRRTGHEHRGLPLALLPYAIAMHALLLYLSPSRPARSLGSTRHLPLDTDVRWCSYTRSTDALC